MKARFTFRRFSSLAVGQQAKKESAQIFSCDFINFTLVSRFYFALARVHFRCLRSEILWSWGKKLSCDEIVSRRNFNAHKLKLTPGGSEFEQIVARMNMKELNELRVSSSRRLKDHELIRDKLLISF